MARISLAEAQAWLEPTKLTLDALDEDLLDHLEAEVLSRLEAIFDTSGWTTDSNTPKLVRTIISKFYAAWTYDRQYSEDQLEVNEYATRLMQNAEGVLTGIIDGNITIPEVPDPETERQPSFYPNDASSALEPTDDDPSLGGPYFSLSKAF